jgi:hypothetical protein
MLLFPPQGNPPAQPSRVAACQSNKTTKTWAQNLTGLQGFYIFLVSIEQDVQNRQKGRLNYMLTKEENEEARELVERGDVNGMLQLIKGMRYPDYSNFIERVDYLMQAYRVAVRQSRDGALSDVYLMMIDFTVELLAISQIQANDVLSKKGQGNLTGVAAMQQLDRILPTVERLHQHLMELTKSYATTQHTRQLTQNALSRADEAPRPVEAARASLPRQRVRRK